jgi:transposase
MKRIVALRAKGIGWKQIAADMGVGVGTIYRCRPRGFQDSGKRVEVSVA